MNRERIHITQSQRRIQRLSAALQRLVSMKSVALLNQRRQRLSHIVQMTEPISLFDFSHVRCQAMVVEYIRNPSGEISPSRVSAKRCDRCARQQRDKLLQRSSGRPNRLSRYP